MKKQYFILAGGLFKADYPLLRETIETKVKEVCKGCLVLSGRAEPIEGACNMGKNLMSTWESNK